MRRRRERASGGGGPSLAAVVFVGLAPGVAAAQDPPPDRATEFVAVEGPTTEDVPGGALLIGAYAIAWALMLVYVVRLGRLHDTVRADLERLSKAIHKADERK